MGAAPEVLSFSIYVSARFASLDTKAKYHHVMRCCPSCGAPLVLFREKFGEVSSPGRSPAGGTGGGASRSPPVKHPPDTPGQPPPPAAGLPGGWVCTKCGVHIVPNDKPQGSISPRERKPSMGGGPSPDKNFSRSSPHRSSSTSRENSPHRSNPHHQNPHQHHHNTPTNTTPTHQASPHSPNKQDKASTSPSSPKPPVIIDDDYEIWERNVKSSFVSFLQQIRERLGQKEASLKQYQVTLCQRERQLRSNEEGMQQRLNKMKHSEQNFKTKMDRLSLYKDSMINQLEAKARQLSHYENRSRQHSDSRSSEMDLKGSIRDINESLRSVKGSTIDPRALATEDLQNISVHSTRSTSGDGKNVSHDYWNTSVASERPNNTFNSPTEPVRSPKSPPHADNRSDYRANVGVTMVKPMDMRTSVSSLPGDAARGSQNVLSRDFRPNGASSANINQIYTKKENPNVYNRAMTPNPQHYYHHRPQQNIPLNKYQEPSKNRKWPPMQKATSPPTSPKNSSYDLRQTVYPTNRPMVEMPKRNGPVVEMSKRNGTVSNIRGTKQTIPPDIKPQPLKSALKSPDSAAQRWSTHSNLHVMTNGHHRPHTVSVTTFAEQDSGSPTDRERSASGFSDLSPTYTTSGYASDRDNSMNGGGWGGGGGGSGRKPEKEKHNVSFDDMITTSSPQNTVERDTRPPWMKRRSRRLTEV